MLRRGFKHNGDGTPQNLALELDGINQLYAPAALRSGRFTPKKNIPAYSLNTSLAGSQRRAVHLENT